MTTTRLAIGTRTGAQSETLCTEAAKRSAVLFCASAQEADIEADTEAARRRGWAGAIAAAIIINGVFVAAFAWKIAAFVAVAAR